LFTVRIRKSTIKTRNPQHTHNNNPIQEVEEEGRERAYIKAHIPVSLGVSSQAAG
jgi:hypothetical protein